MDEQTQFMINFYPLVVQAIREQGMKRKADGGSLEKRKLWDDLSMREKSEMMRVAVRNGIMTLPEIREKYNEFAEGGHIFDGESEKVNYLYKPEGRVTYNVTEVNPRMVGYDAETQTFHDRLDGRRIGDSVVLDGVTVTPSNGTIDSIGNQYQTIGGITHMTTPNGRRVVMGEKPVSGVDPVGEFVVEGAAMAPMFKPVEAVVGGVLGAPEIVKSGRELAGTFFEGAERMMPGFYKSWKVSNAMNDSPIAVPENFSYVTPKVRTASIGSSAPETPAAQWAKVGNTPKITADNAMNITDAQWDAAYNAAIESGDIAETQRLRDLHFIVKSNGHYVGRNQNVSEDELAHIYHGTTADFNVFIPSRKGTYGEGIYMHPTEKDAIDSSIHHAGDKRVLNLYAKMENPIDIRTNNLFDYMMKMQEFNVTKNPRAFIDKGYDGVMGIPYNKGKNTPLEVVVHNPSSVKLADAVTYDDKGNFIPLSQRDNFNINDMRYGVIPVLSMGMASKIKQDK